MENELEKWTKKESIESFLKANPEYQALKSEVKRLKELGEKRYTWERVVKDAVKEAFVPPTDIRFPKPPTAQRPKEHLEVAVLHATDWQIGKESATYSSEIAAKRIDLLADKAIQITNMRRHAATIDEIHVYFGGDMVEGEEIFKGQGFEIDSNLLTQACKTAPTIMTNLIIKLFSSFKTVKVFAVQGNHGRVGSSGNAHKYTNWDLVSYHVSKHMIEATAAKLKFDLDSRFSYEIADDKFWIVDNVLGWGQLIVHGDQVSGSGGVGKFPLGSVASKIYGWAESIEAPWDVIWLGHRHVHLNFSINDKIILSTGSPESDNQYALEVLAAKGYPSQRLAFFNASHGLISDNQIFLCDEGVRKPARYKYLNYGKVNQ